jgi:hypothetical protein
VSSALEYSKDLAVVSRPSSHALNQAIQLSPPGWFVGARAAGPDDKKIDIAACGAVASRC